MSSSEQHFDCVERADAAPYVLGALPDAERYREHLATCAACRAEVAELQHAVNMLPATVPAATAPEGLRQRVLRTVHSEAELLRAATDTAREPSPRASRSRPRRFSLWSVGIAVAAVAALGVVVAISVGPSTRERVTAAQIAPAARGASASLREVGGRGELVLGGMPQPPSGKIYEVWLSRGAGTPQPTDALFGVTSRGSGSVDIPSLRGVKEVVVTSEPFGGSSHPTSPPVLRIVLPA